MQSFSDFKKMDKVYNIDALGTTYVSFLNHKTDVHQDVMPVDIIQKMIQDDNSVIEITPPPSDQSPEQKIQMPLTTTCFFGSLTVVGLLIMFRLIQKTRG